jgi:hypothetical protein
MNMISEGEKTCLNKYLLPSQCKGSRISVYKQEEMLLDGKSVVFVL